MTSVKKLLAASVLVVVVGGVSVGPGGQGPIAGADPSFVSAKVGVGPDSGQDLFDAFGGTEPYSGSGAPNPPTFYAPLNSGSSTTASADAITVSSFDAVPFGGSASAPGFIVTKPGDPALDRPNGSNSGIAALRASIGQGTNPAGANFWQTYIGLSATGRPVNVAGDIDFVASSRGPNTVGSTLTFIPFARDGVTYALLQAAGDTNNLGSLTTAQLKSIYYSASASFTVGTDTVKGCLPQAGSGIGTAFEGAIGVDPSVSQPEAIAAGCNALEQNGGNTFYTFASGQEASNPNTAYIIPFSVGSWIAQANGVAADNSANGRANGVVLGDPDGLGGGPTTGTAPNLAPNTPYYQNSQYGADLFVVVPTAKLTGLNSDKALVKLFSGSSSAICTTSAQGTANKFGFDSLNTNDFTKNTSGTLVNPQCGDTTTLTGSN